MKKTNRYGAIIEAIFLKHFKKGKSEFDFTRDEFVQVAKKLKIDLPKNIGDILYSFRYRTNFPKSILDRTPDGFEWTIPATGKATYKFKLRKQTHFKPSPNLSQTKILDSTPGLIAKYALTDEQALLAKLRYNRLIDIFTGLTCYSLQNHLRTTVPDMGQVETDEVYIGVDKKGVHFVIPVQAKGGKDKLGAVQIEQDFAIGKAKFPHLVCKPIAAQFMQSRQIALFEFEMTDTGISIVSEKHYLLVNIDELTPAELEMYKTRN